PKKTSAISKPAKKTPANKSSGAKPSARPAARTPAAGKKRGAQA
ncbi:class III poly(R)-hydroxyalkanoic acid synthase subunit PhaE, partial [Xanthomonas oryzae pv. oryzae]